MLPPYRAATDGIPLNYGFTGKGNDSGQDGLENIVRAGACGLKLHEDWGTTPTNIDSCLDIGDQHDVQVNIHTDTLNESGGFCIQRFQAVVVVSSPFVPCLAGFVESTIAAFKGRTIHTFVAQPSLSAKSSFTDKKYPVPSTATTRRVLEGVTPPTSLSFAVRRTSFPRPPTLLDRSPTTRSTSIST